jgi:HAD superfamily hydrolase (TIGR01509 family)
MIKGFLFDWFGVCTKENWGDCVVRELHKKTGIDEVKIKKEYKTFLQDLMSVKLSPDEFFEKFLRNVDPRIKPEEYHYLLKIIPDMNHETLTLILQLRKKYTVYLLSNIFAELFEKYEKKIVFKEYFDGMFLSHELKISKNDDRIWNVVLKKVQLKPDELIFIDNREMYLEIARKRGVNTILFKNNDQLRKDLENFGIRA